jgi:hypothetical protein
MPNPSPTRIDYGNSLDSPGKRQPNGQVHIDAFGLAQAQLTFALDSSASSVENAIDTVSMGINYPEDIGFPMKSYKYAIAYSKGGVAMLTIDYMGVARGAGYTDAQVNGVANTTSQPIETHPNFKIHDGRWVVGPLAGYPGNNGANLTSTNNPIFIKMSTDNGDGTAQETWKFNGFGFTPNGAVTAKSGVRQFLRPQGNIRGTMFFNNNNQGKAMMIFNNIGNIVMAADTSKLVPPFTYSSFSSAQALLITSAQLEVIGTPSNPAGTKMVYDVLVSGDDGWDLDIYQTAAQIFA